MNRFKIFILYLISFAFSIGPLFTYLIVNKDRYFCTKYDAIKLFSGGLIIMVMLLLKTLKKLKIPTGVSFFGLICMLSYLLSPVIQDLTVLSFLALVGEIGDSIMQAIISKEKRKLFAREISNQINR